jgi:signal transduction histidine kinase/ActR/RegA family two-component response regulator
MWDTILAGKEWRGELNNRKKNGESYWELASISPIMNTAGAITHFVAVKEDITERKRLEAQLRQAQKLEAIGQLAGGVAHDFNNILAAIIMQVGLLQMKSDLNEEIRQALKELEAGAQRAASLTRQLLMFSRRSVLAVKPVDLNEVVTHLLKMLNRLIGEQIDLRFDRKTDLPIIDADAGMLDQVLMNLVVNARDAMPKGGRITIGTSVAHLGAAQAAENPERRPGTFVCLKVLDTGCGMDPTTSKRIFEPFFTTKEIGKGTGLGLATVHGIVAQHKGWLEVESEVGHGTCFLVYLPVSDLGTQEPQARTKQPVKHGTETILLVEDDLEVRRLFCQALRALGYQVHEANDGPQAMGIWKEYSSAIDLLLTDMVMPQGMTGLDLAERLQALKPSLKVIISSGYSAEMVQVGPPKKQSVVYLPKPYEAKVLADTVRNCLDLSNSSEVLVDQA